MLITVNDLLVESIWIRLIVQLVLPAKGSSVAVFIDFVICVLESV